MDVPSFASCRFRLWLVHLLDLGRREFLARVEIDLMLLAGPLVRLLVDLHLLVVLLALARRPLLLRRSDRLRLGFGDLLLVFEARGVFLALKLDFLRMLLALRGHGLLVLLLLRLDLLRLLVCIGDNVELVLLRRLLKIGLPLDMRRQNVMRGGGMLNLHVLLLLLVVVL